MYRREDIEEQKALIGLSMVPGVGPGRIRKLVAFFGSPAAVLRAPAHRLARVDGVGMKSAVAISTFSPGTLVEEQLHRADDVGADMLTLWDPDYPALLREIFDPPVLLWYRGLLPPSDGIHLAIVGTRRPSDAGRRHAREFAEDVGKRGVAVVSGLASGIDTEAHRGALQAGALTVAVLGSGVDRIYPYPNTRLAEEIAASGAIVSEYPLGAAPDAVNFPRRNRIISGMSHGTLVIEAHSEGGALITARLALEQNREVFAVPGSIYNKAVAGCHELIQNGHAKLVSCTDHVLSEIAPNAKTKPERKKALDRLIGQLPEIEQMIMGLLGGEPVHIDVLCERLSLDVSTLLVHLLTLEFKGLVNQMAGKHFYREGS